MTDSIATWLQHAPKPAPLPSGKEYHVFLSYRSVNRAWVINLYDVLRAHGHKVFLDQCVLSGGTALIGELQKGLTRSLAGVLVWSSAAADSEWVEREYEVMEQMASAGSFRFVPVRVDTTAFPPFAARRIFLDFSRYPDGPNGGELLRLMHALVGQALSPEAARFAADQDEAARLATAAVKAAIGNGSVADLQQLFAAGGLAWETSAALGCAAAEGCTKLKRNDEAIVILSELEQRFPSAIRVKQLKAHALSRRGKQGDLAEAQRILGQLYELGHRDPETIGMYARTWMDRYADSHDVLDLRRSRDLYVEAFGSAQDDYYTGVNAAAKSVLLGTPEDLARGKELAARVQGIVGTEPTRGDYWRTATTAEVQLLQGNYSEAARLYTEAVAMAPKELGSQGTTWLQAFRLMVALKPNDEDRALVRNAFSHLADDPTPAG
jgi:tetratricopeptide (TPR) repeat protein